jgi:hypothetical protein
MTYKIFMLWTPGNQVTWSTGLRYPVKTEKIVIRCDEELYLRWKLFLLRNKKKFRTAAEALRYLLDKEEAPKIKAY